MLTNRTQVKPGDWVLVIGASSGVGSAGIQIAKALGGRVISTGSSEAKRDLARRLGRILWLIQPTPRGRRRCAPSRKNAGGRGGGTRGRRGVAEGFDCLARGGTVVTCGPRREGRDDEPVPFFVKQQRLVAVMAATAPILLRRWNGRRGKLKPVMIRFIRWTRPPRRSRICVRAKRWARYDRPLRTGPESD